MDRSERPLVDDRHETPTERLDRNWAEILQELRVTQTGIQILTGFLLTVPFQQRFTDLSDEQRGFYLVLVLLAAVTTGLMVAPVSLHRMLFRRRAKSALVTEADRFMRVGLVFLALTVSGVVLLVFDVVTTRAAALTASLLLLAGLVAAWFVLPTVLGRASRRVADQQTPPPDPHT
ncbi:DUF6328 family protein [Actinotalea fermentans]|uniref:Membrane protein n=1 Tax=Actinotalea fermentans TaxID=43671 RepID=A0A511Z2I9_9CELL|nr:DUF6328 family protein [Actinotalea fermentans]KGM16159.1 sodium:proton antiporter [Actinotalea fermentans ATCC 43279 = JCM 9966 = DSM 3133]GEN81665.1 membrane protein [Actinotalea fermentans]